MTGALPIRADLQHETLSGPDLRDRRAARKREAARFRIVISPAAPDELRTGRDRMDTAIGMQQARAATPLNPTAGGQQR